MAIVGAVGLSRLTRRMGPPNGLQYADSIAKGRFRCCSTCPVAPTRRSKLPTPTKRSGISLLQLAVQGTGMPEGSIEKGKFAAGTVPEMVIVPFRERILTPKSA